MFPCKEVSKVLPNAVNHPIKKANDVNASPAWTGNSPTGRKEMQSSFATRELSVYDWTNRVIK
jgi:hypothetical protein